MLWSTYLHCLVTKVYTPPGGRWMAPLGVIIVSCPPGPLRRFLLRGSQESTVSWAREGLHGISWDFMEFVADLWIFGGLARWVPGTLWQVHQQMLMARFHIFNVLKALWLGISHLTHGLDVAPFFWATNGFGGTQLFMASWVDLSILFLAKFDP